MACRDYIVNISYSSVSIFGPKFTGFLYGLPALKWTGPWEGRHQIRGLQILKWHKSAEWSLSKNNIYRKESRGIRQKNMDEVWAACSLQEY